MTTRETVVREGNGVRLVKSELLDGGGAASTAYVLRSQRTPQQSRFLSMAEADAAFLNELALSEGDPSRL